MSQWASDRVEQSMLRYRSASLCLGMFCALSPMAARADCVSLVSGAGGPSFWQQVEAGARQASRETGLRLYFRGPLTEPDEQNQLQIVELMLAHGCRALIVAPSGPAIAERLRRLKAQGIATFYIDRDLGGDEVVSAIATDNHQAGLLAGRRMAHLLRGRGRVGVLRPDSQAGSVADRISGFVQGATAGGLEVVLVARVSVRSYTPTDADLRLAQSLDGLFSVSERTTQGALAVLRRSGHDRQPLHIGFDADALLIEALRRGELAGLLLQQAWEMGYRSVWAAHRHLRGDGASPRRDYLEALYVDAERLAEPGIRRLLPVAE